MKNILDIKNTFISLLVTLVVGGIFSWVTDIDYLYSLLIIGGAILVNGLIIAVIEKGDNDKDE